jgi:hypothetical protein
MFEWIQVKVSWPKNSSVKINSKIKAPSASKNNQKLQILASSQNQFYSTATKMSKWTLHF